jgi:hypothetical protein
VVVWSCGHANVKYNKLDLHVLKTGSSVLFTVVIVVYKEFYKHCGTAANGQRGRWDRPY